MALPKLQTPTYELKLETLDSPIQFRPYLVKEEKILMIASETGDEKSIIRALTQIVKSCTFNKIDVESLPVFDIEYLFLNIRSKSVGETVKINVTCPDDKKTTVSKEVNINDVKVKKSENHKNVIDIVSSTNETKNIVTNFVELINSKPIWIDPKKHDELISLTSHLPHILSSALVSTAMQKHNIDELLDLASGGFDGATRLSRTSPNMISDMYLTNDLNVKTLIKELIEELEKIILIEDQELMLNYLSKTVDWRRALADKFGERKLK